MKPLLSGNVNFKNTNCLLNKFRQWERLVLVSIVILLILLTSFCSNDQITKNIEGSTMGTFYTVTYQGDTPSSELKPLLENHLSKIENQLSNWDKDSWISHFNSSKVTKFTPAPEHAYQVIKSSLKISAYTNGALDPTLGRLINLWGFGPNKSITPPDTNAIKKLLEASGGEKLKIKDSPPSIAKTHPDLHLNVSSVTKGYAADVLAGYLKSEGIIDYLINIGGDIRISGSPPNNNLWNIAIQRPEPIAQDRDTYVTVELSNAGIATSGDYRRFIEIDGQHYPHVLDPNSGHPVNSKLASVTIIAPTSFQADGIATACLVLGLEQAQKLVERTPNTEGLFIERAKPNQFHSFVSSGWPGPS